MRANVPILQILNLEIRDLVQIVRSCQIYVNVVYVAKLYVATVTYIYTDLDLVIAIPYRRDETMHQSDAQLIRCTHFSH